MDMQSGEDAAVANAGNWLRLTFHALTCNNQECMLGERCTAGKQLLNHVLACENPAACSVASCTSVRRLMLHWLKCQDVNCRLCAGVWSDLSGANEHDGNQQRVGWQPRGHLVEPVSPAEAPGTPYRVGPSAQAATEGSEWPVGQAANGVMSTGYVQGEHVLSYVASDDMAGPVADRAVIQLQEATCYMRYLLHSLMCRQAREAPSRAPGLQFWLDALMPQPPELQQQPLWLQQQQQAGQQPVFGAPQQPWRPEPLALPPAGRRLLSHRLACRNSYCALCAGTCELFTRGNGLRADLPVPTGLRDMDQIVEELSLALGSVNL